MVIIFDEDTPLELIKSLAPDVLIKGNDYSIDTIVGAKEVIEMGGEVCTIELVPNYSTTGIIQKLKN
jgi:bifunctional ADP-heptose synthase (sugar kinase/adenylyltransferase)